MNMDRKKLNKYEYLCDMEAVCMDYTFESMYKALQDVDDNNFVFVQAILEEMLGCKGVLTKSPIYAVDRAKAIQKVGFAKSEYMLIGKTGYAYDGHWTIG